MEYLGNEQVKRDPCIREQPHIILQPGYETACPVAVASEIFFGVFHAVVVQQVLDPGFYAAGKLHYSCAVAYERTVVETVLRVDVHTAELPAHQGLRQLF